MGELYKLDFAKRVVRKAATRETMKLLGRIFK